MTIRAISESLSSTQRGGLLEEDGFDVRGCARAEEGLLLLVVEGVVVVDEFGVLVVRRRRLHHQVLIVRVDGVGAVEPRREFRLVHRRRRRDIRSHHTVDVIGVLS